MKELTINEINTVNGGMILPPAPTSNSPRIPCIEVCCALGIVVAVGSFVGAWIYRCNSGGTGFLCFEGFPPEKNSTHIYKPRNNN